jgi:hypothetical protein
VTLAHVNGQAACALEEDPVKGLARNGERVVTIAAHRPSVGYGPMSALPSGATMRMPASG